MKNKDLKKIVKIILIAGIILCGVAQILPWGRLELAAPEEIPIPGFNNINLNYFHWGGIQINPKLPGVQEWIFTPTETEFFSGVTGSPELYGWAFATLLVYLIVPLGIISLGAGIVAYKKVGGKRSKNSLYAAVFSIMAVFLFIVFIQLSLLLNIEEAPSSILQWSWSIGFYLMIISSILFFIAYATIWKIYSEEDVVQTPKKKKAMTSLERKEKRI
jgi:hypothetical protein